MNRSNTPAHLVLRSWCSVVADSVRPCGLQPARLLCAWDSPGRNTAVGDHALPGGDLPPPRVKPASPALAGVFFTTSAAWETLL